MQPLPARIFAGIRAAPHSKVLAVYLRRGMLPPARCAANSLSIFKCRGLPHMTTEEATLVARMPSHWRRFVRAYYQLPRSVNLVYALDARGVTYHQLLMMFARVRFAHCALEALTGCTVRIYPAVRLSYHYNSRRPRVLVPRGWRDCHVTYVNRTFSLKYGPLLRERVTPRSLHARGVPWRTLQRMHDEGHLRVCA